MMITGGGGGPAHGTPGCVCPDQLREDGRDGADPSADRDLDSRRPVYQPGPLLGMQAPDAPTGTPAPVAASGWQREGVLGKEEEQQMFALKNKDKRRRRGNGRQW